MLSKRSSRLHGRLGIRARNRFSLKTRTGRELYDGDGWVRGNVAVDRDRGDGLSVGNDYPPKYKDHSVV